MKKILCVIVSLIMLLSNATFASANTVHNPTKDRKGANVWDCIWLGEYPQTALKSIKNKNKDSNIYVNGLKGYCFNEENYKVFNTEEGYYKYEPVKWRVLSVSGSKAFLISNQILDKTHYYTGKFTDGDMFYQGPKDALWSNSNIRSYLVYMGNCIFSNTEQDAIIPTINKTDYIDDYYARTISTETTTDNIFLLSYKDVPNESYGFDSKKESTKADATDMTKQRIEHDYGSYAWTVDNGYYLRSDGTVYVDQITPYGIQPGAWTIDADGTMVNKNATRTNGVRPAMWIDLSKTNYQYAGTVKSDGTGTEILFSLSKGKVVKTKKYSKKSKKIKVNLKAVKYADGQQVKVYTTKKKAKSNKKAIFNKKTTKINNKFKSKKFKNKKKLYVRARGYVKKNGKTKYGAWSKIKKVTKK